MSKYPKGAIHEVAALVPELRLRFQTSPAHPIHKVLNAVEALQELASWQPHLERGLADLHPQHRRAVEVARALLANCECRHEQTAFEALRELDTFAGRVRDLEAVLREYEARASWYIRCLEDVQDRRPVRGLAEAKAGYDASRDKLAALAPAENQPRAEGAWGQPYADAMRFVPEGDTRCDAPMDACRCMKRSGHDGDHACTHGYWAAAPAEER